MEIYGSVLLAENTWVSPAALQPQKLQRQPEDSTLALLFPSSSWCSQAPTPRDPRRRAPAPSLLRTLLQRDPPVSPPMQQGLGALGRPEGWREGGAGIPVALTHQRFREAHLRGLREDVQMEQAEPGHAQQQEAGVQRGEEDPGEACWDSPHGLRGLPAAPTPGSIPPRRLRPRADQPRVCDPRPAACPQRGRAVRRTRRALTCRSCRGHQALLSLPAALGGRAHGHRADTVPRALLQVPEGARCSPPAPPAGHLQAEGTRGRGTERHSLCNRFPLPVFPSPNRSFFSTPASQKRKGGSFPAPGCEP